MNMQVECYANDCYMTWEEPPLGDLAKDTLRYKFSYPRTVWRWFNQADPQKGLSLTPLFANTNYTLYGSTLFKYKGKELDIGRTNIRHFRTLTLRKYLFLKRQTLTLFVF